MRENDEAVAVPAPAVSCVIVGFHRPDLLSRLVELLADPRVEIIVVNIEDDPAIRQTPGAKIIAVPMNVGYAAGVNIGAQKAAAEVMLFMNDDVAVTAADALAMGERVRSGSADVVVPLVENQQGALELAEKPPYRLAERMQAARPPRAIRTVGDRRGMGSSGGVAHRAHAIRAHAGGLLPLLGGARVVPRIAATRCAG